MEGLLCLVRGQGVESQELLSLVFLHFSCLVLTSVWPWVTPHGTGFMLYQCFSKKLLLQNPLSRLLQVVVRTNPFLVASSQWRYTPTCSGLRFTAWCPEVSSWGIAVSPCMLYVLNGICEATTHSSFVCSSGKFTVTGGPHICAWGADVCCFLFQICLWFPSQMETSGLLNMFEGTTIQDEVYLITSLLQGTSLV